MIIPSIDIQNGQAVQLRSGKEKVIDGGDPYIWAEKFCLVSEIAVIDLDRALSTGSNKELIKGLIKKYRCRVGGGIRTVEEAIEYLELGARKIIIGTKATKEFLKALPKERIIAALDTRYGKVVVEGWNVETKNSVEEKILELKDFVGGFLVTLVETEGSLQGIDIERCKTLKKLCGSVPLTVAGGVYSTAEIAELDRLGIDVQVGMALYSGKIEYADAVVSPLKSDRPDGLWPTVVVDEMGTSLGLVYSNLESVREALKQRKGIYFSRSRGIWEKGKTSGNTQELLKIELDCDRDCLKFTVRQSGPGFCHTGSFSCWNDAAGISKLFSTIQERKYNLTDDSYTKMLIENNDLLSAKVKEEAYELVDAKLKEDVIHEASDLLYFILVKLAKEGVTLSEINNELDNRSLKVVKRFGGIKPKFTSGGIAE